jgi:hypothetical protein
MEENLVVLDLKGTEKQLFQGIKIEKMIHHSPPRLAPPTRHQPTTP